MTSKYTEAVRITMFERGTVGLDISDDRLLSDPALAQALQHVEAAANILKTARRNLVPV